MCELAYCQPIVVLLLILLSFNTKIQNCLSQNPQNNPLSNMLMCCVSLQKWERCNPLAKTCLLWQFKMTFISNKSLNNGTFTCFKHIQTDRDTKIQNFLSRNHHKNCFQVLSYTLRIRDVNIQNFLLQNQPSHTMHRFSLHVHVWVLSIMPEIPKRSVSVSSDRNIWHHLSRWSTYFDQNIPTKLYHSIFDELVLCPN